MHKNYLAIGLALCMSFIPRYSNGQEAAEVRETPLLPQEENAYEVMREEGVEPIDFFKALFLLDPKRDEYNPDDPRNYVEVFDSKVNKRFKSDSTSLYFRMLDADGSYIGTQEELRGYTWSTGLYFKMLRTDGSYDKTQKELGDHIESGIMRSLWSALVRKYQLFATMDEAIDEIRDAAGYHKKLDHRRGIVGDLSVSIYPRTTRLLEDLTSSITYDLTDSKTDKKLWGIECRVKKEGARLGVDVHDPFGFGNPLRFGIGGEWVRDSNGHKDIFMQASYSMKFGPSREFTIDEQLTRWREEDVEGQERIEAEENSVDNQWDAIIKGKHGKAEMERLEKERLRDIFKEERNEFKQMRYQERIGRDLKNVMIEDLDKRRLDHQRDKLKIVEFLYELYLLEKKGKL